MAAAKLCVALTLALNALAGCRHFTLPDPVEEPEQTGQLAVTILPDGLQEVPVSFDGEFACLPSGAEMEATVGANEAASFFEWYLDGEPLISGDNTKSVTVGSDLQPGIHTLSVVVTVEAYLFSDSFRFVVEAPI